MRRRRGGAGWRVSILIVLMAMAAGCASAPFPLAAPPAGALRTLPADESASLVLPAGDGWAVVRMLASPGAWVEDRGQTYLYLHSAPVRAEPKLGFCMIFLVEDGALELAGVVRQLDDWTYATNERPRRAVDLVLVFVAVGLEAPTELRLGFSDPDGVLPVRSGPANVLANGTGAAASWFLDAAAATGRQREAHGVEVEDRRPGTFSAPAVEPSGSLAIRLLHELDAPGLHVATTDAVAEAKVGRWGFNATLDGRNESDASPLVSSPATGRRIVAELLGIGRVAAHEVTVAADAPGAFASVEVTALSVPWDPAQAGLALPYSYARRGGEPAS